MRTGVSIALSIAAAAGLYALPGLPMAWELTQPWALDGVATAADDDDEWDDWSPMPEAPEDVAATSSTPEPPAPPTQYVNVKAKPKVEKPKPVEPPPDAVALLPSDVPPSADAPPTVIAAEPPTEVIDDDGLADLYDDDEDGTADADVSDGAGGTDAKAPKAAKSHPKRPAATPKKKKDKKKASTVTCDPPSESIAQSGDAHWIVQRDLVEFYATHPFQLDDQGYVWTHKDADGEMDGFAMRLSKCSILRQVGFKSGDVVHTVNGVEIDTLWQAVGAYFRLHDEHDFEVAITRKGEDLTLRYHIPTKREERAARSDGVAEAR